MSAVHVLVAEEDPAALAHHAQLLVGGLHAPQLLLGVRLGAGELRRAAR